MSEGFQKVIVEMTVQHYGTPVQAAEAALDVINNTRLRFGDSVLETRIVVIPAVVRQATDTPVLRSFNDASKER